MSNIKIVTIYHKRYPTYSDIKEYPDLYVPILAGNTLGLTKPFIENMLVDDIGDNISWVNPYLNEVTAMYWIWKHAECIGNPEFIGVCHYRRFFNMSDIQKVFEGKLVVNKEFLPVPELDALSFTFESDIPIQAIDLAEHTLDTDGKFPKKWFYEYMNLLWQYNREMFVCPWYIFDELMIYLTKLFPYMFKHIKYDHRTSFTYRNMSLVTECMIGFFFYCLGKSGFKLHEADYAFFVPEGFTK